MTEALYDQKLVARARRARGTSRLTNPQASATLDNPLCGDRVTIDLTLAPDGKIIGLGHEVRGCLLCEAAADLLSEVAPGKTADQLRQGESALASLLSGGETPDGTWAGLADFVPVAEVKSRQDCVRLPFRALAAAFGKLSR